METMTTQPKVNPLRQTLRNWIDAGLLPPLEGLNVWDIGCGWGDFSIAMLEEGAAHAIATDIVFDHGQISADLKADSRVTLVEGTVEQLASRVYAGEFGRVPDLLFMHLMTEHVADLRPFFAALRKGMPPSCAVFVHHDNYYQPTGHHDHLFLSLDPATYSIETRTVPCWTLPERCAASEAHRSRLVAWQWEEASARTVGDDCSRCNYRLRSEPWAHLIHQSRFRQVWPEAMFANAMNKATTFQVRQFMLEAGFDIVREHRTWIGNEPSKELVAQFTRRELKTFTITFLAGAGSDRPALDPDPDGRGYRRY